MKIKLMTFVMASLIAHVSVAQNITINKGSGSFTIKKDQNNKKGSLTIFYHRPENFTSNSRILLVIPGAGRNANDYRDSWVEVSEKQNVLIVAPSYPEKAYNYGDYHLGGVVKNLNLSKGISFVKGTNQVKIDENVVEFKVNNNQKDWIFNDFDKIFKLVKKATKSRQRKYDMFGHSAGGQILHRFALLFPNSRADKILASNAGTYTLPDYKTNYPFGVKNVDIKKQQLKKAFRKKLVLLLGALDNDTEKRGRMLRSKTADKQGTNRLDRGKYFYKMSKEVSKKSKWRFDWKLEIVPNVGHNQKKMAKAAAKYLYGKK